MENEEEENPLLEHEEKDDDDDDDTTHPFQPGCSFNTRALGRRNSNDDNEQRKRERLRNR